MTACGAETSSGDAHGAPLGDGTTCCAACAAKLARRLHGVPDLVADLEITFSRQDRLGEPGASADGTLAWKHGAPDAVWALGNTLTVWAREIAARNKTTIDADVVARRPIRDRRPAPLEDSDRGAARCDETGLLPDQCGHCLGLPAIRPLPEDAVPARPRDGVPAPTVLGYRRPTALDTLRIAARWLVRHIDLVRRDVEAVQAHDEIMAAIAQAEAACGAPPLRLYVGRCDRPIGYGEPDEHGHHPPILCGEDLYATSNFAAVTCPRCQTLHSDMAARWDRALHRVRLYPATAALIAAHVGSLFGVQLDRKTINQWHHRGKIEPVDHDEDGHPRFRIGAVLDEARRTERKAG